MRLAATGVPPARRAVQPQGGAEPSAQAVGLACALLLADAAALAAVTGDAPAVGAVNEVLDAAGVPAAEALAADWLCAPFLWPVGT